MSKWISVEDQLPEEPFIGLNQRQGNNQVMAWWDRVHKRYLYTGGVYYGTKEHPGFTHWQPKIQPPEAQ